MRTFTMRGAKINCKSPALQADSSHSALRRRSFQVMSYIAKLGQLCDLMQRCAPMATSLKAEAAPSRFKLADHPRLRVALLMLYYLGVLLGLIKLYGRG